MAISVKLQTLLDNFAGTLPQGKNSLAYQQLVQTFNDSPALLSKFNEYAERNEIKVFTGVTQQQGIGASFTPGKLSIDLPISASGGIIGDLTFLLGHEGVDFTRSARQIIMSKTERSKSHEGYQIHGRI